MKLQRTLIFVAAFLLAATLFTPRTGPLAHYYEFVFVARGRVDYQQWLINACVAALVGFLLAQLPRRALRGVAIVVVVAAIVAATGLVLSGREARRMEARKQAHRDEIYARELFRGGLVQKGKQHLRNAAANWHAAGDTEQEKRLLEYERSVKDVFDNYLNDPIVEEPK
jgi:hypothetical protein